MHIAPYFTALGLLAVYFSWNVIALRRKHRVGIGHGGHQDLERMIRVQGNFMEYAPMGLIMLLALEWVEAPIWFVHLAGMSPLIGRILHGLGLAKNSGITRFRVVGILLTFLSITLSAIGILIFSFMMPVI